MRFEKKIAAVLLDSGLIEKFYHSTTLVKQDGSRLKVPAYCVSKTEMYYIGPDNSTDNHAYMRANGATRSTKGIRVSSAGQSMRLTTPHRIVITSRVNLSLAEVYAKLALLESIEGVKISAFITDSEKLGIDETGQPLSFEFAAIHCGVDINISYDVHPWAKKESCPTNCETPVNPICK